MEAPFAFRLSPFAFLRDVPVALRIGIVFYLLHVLLQGKTAALELGAFWTILFTAWSVARREIRPRWFHVLLYPLALYGIASTLSALVNGAVKHPWLDAMTWFKMLIFPATLIIFRHAPPMRDLTLRALIVFAVWIASSGLYQWFTLDPDQRTLEHRITGPSSHVMTYSGVLLPLSLLLLVLAAHRRRIWMIAATAIVSSALLLTLTRSVWLGWMVAVLVVLTLKGARWLPHAVGLLLILVTLLPIDFFARMVSSFDVRQSSNHDRIRMAEAGVEMIKDYPLLGVGPGNVKEIYPLYRKHDAPRFRPPHLHNNFLQIWAERGILALFAYVVLIGLFLRECARGWRGPNRVYAEAGVAIVVGLTVAGLFEFNFGDTEVFYMTLELFALIVTFLEVPVEVASNEPAMRLVAPVTA
jgi:O-antigen ligase